ncbi:unnamed protein product, partial [Adineta steineri]
SSTTRIPSSSCTTATCTQACFVSPFDACKSSPSVVGNIGEKKSSKRLTKSVISNALSPQPVLTPVDNKPQHECNTTKCGTPLANRLSKRKITSSSVTDMKNNGKPAKANSCGGSASSITSKKRRR